MSKHQFNELHSFDEGRTTNELDKRSDFLDYPGSIADLTVDSNEKQLELDGISASQDPLQYAHPFEGLAKLFEEDFFLELEEIWGEEEGSDVEEVEEEEEPEASKVFFSSIGKIPEVSEVERDLPIELQKSYDYIFTGRNLDGWYADPVTGKKLRRASEERTLIKRTKKEEKEAIEEHDQSEADEEEQTEEYEEEAEDEEDDELNSLIRADKLEADQEAAAIAATQEETVFEAFMDTQMTKQVVFGYDENDVENLEMLKEHELLVDNTTEFLNDLIKMVVEEAEYEDPNTILGRSLDKMKLVIKTQDLLHELVVEKKINVFLNRKCVEYYRRKKSYRQISEDKAEEISDNFQKFIDAAYHLDEVLGRKQEAVRINAEKIQDIRYNVRDWETKLKHKIETFENLVKKAIGHESNERIQNMIAIQLKTMKDLRDDISRYRYILIHRQHSLAAIKEKSDELENLGNGLCMRDFEQLQTETNALDKKIEERTNDLHKLHFRCNADVHIMAHMMEKQLMLTNTIEIQNHALDDLLIEKQMYREHLHELKKQRARVRKEMNEVSFQCGLLDKPALMRDFDDTTEKQEKLQSKILQMKMKYADLLSKIQIAETETSYVSDYDN